MVVRAFADSKLFFEVLKAEKGMRSIEFFIVLTVASFHFSIVSGRVGPDELMPNVMLLQSFFKQGLFVRALGVEAVGKFRAIVGLDALNGKTPPRFYAGMKPALSWFTFPLHCEEMRKRTSPSQRKRPVRCFWEGTSRSAPISCSRLFSILEIL